MFLLEVGIAVVVTLIVLSIIGALCEEKNYVAVFWIVLVYMVVEEWITGMTVIRLTRANALSALMIVFGYLLCGLFYSVVRWRFYVGSHERTIREGIVAWGKKKEIAISFPLSADHRAMLAKDLTQFSPNFSYLFNKLSPDQILEPLDAKSNYNLLVSWAILWIPSLFKFVLYDGVIEGGIRLLSSILQSISNNAHSKNFGIDTDVEK